jgi:hypothetical protein
VVLLSQEDLSQNGETIKKKSKLRQEIEELLQKKGLVLEGISAVNLDTGETYRFKSYPELQKFLKGRKGRWYIATPGLKYAQRDCCR